MKTFKYRRRGTIPFELEVTDETKGGEVTTEQFAAIADLEATELLTVEKVSKKVEESKDPAGKINLSIEMIDEFFGVALTPEEHKRLMDIVGSKHTLIQMQLLVDIMTWLIEEYTGRPTEQPSPS